MSFGLSGNKGSSSSSSNSSTESWLLEMMKPIIGDAIGGAGDMPEYGFAGLNQDQIDALQGIMGGQDWSGLQQGAGALGQMGWDQMTQGGQYLQDAMGQYKDIMGQMSGQGYQDMVQGLYNSDLVNQQLDVMNTQVQGQLDKNIQGINQRASGSGNMGSSRAGVAEGVAIGDAANATAAGTAQIQNAAWGQAITGANNQLGNLASAAGNQLTLGQNLLNQGSSTIGGAMQWGQNISSGQQQDLFNKLTAGGIFQSNAQGQMDTDRLNQILKDNPALGKLQLLLPIIGGTAGWGSSTSGSSSGSSSNVGFDAGFNTGKSDERFKDNIELVREGEVHTMKNGEVFYVPRMYKWEWNEKALAVFEAENYKEVPHSYGVLAQELEAIGLDALVHKFPTDVEGLDGEYRAVNYMGLHDFIRAVYEKVAAEAE